MHTTGQVIIGKVSTRKNARQHLDTDGRAHCGAGRGIIFDDTRWAVDITVDRDTVCRRCTKALRAALAARPSGDEHAHGAALVLAPAAEAMAADAELAADILAFHRDRAAAKAAERTPAQALGLNAASYQKRLLAALMGGPVAPGFEAWAPAETTAALTYGFTPAAA